MAGGVYYKGTVVGARAPPVAGLAAPELLVAFDPWESVRVEWDVTARDEERIQVHRSCSAASSSRNAPLQMCQKSRSC